MQVKQKMRNTEVGSIPDEWRVLRISNLIDHLDAGVSVNSVENDSDSYDDHPSVLKTSAVSNGRFFPFECKRIVGKDLQRAEVNPLGDTIIVSRMNTPELVGECGYVEKDYPRLFLPDRLWLTRTRSNVDYSVKWLSYLLSSTAYKEKLKEAATGTSASMKNLSKESFLRIQIPVPPATEQRSIAEALSDVDALIRSLDKLIAKKRDIKKATMQQLLTGKTRLPGFEGCWTEQNIGDFATVFSGGTPLTSNKSFYGGDIPWITSSDLNQSIIRSVHGRITNSGLVNSSAKLVDAETLLIALYGATAGVTAISKIRAAINQAVLAIIPRSVSKEFLFYKLQLLKDSIVETYTQGGQPNLSGNIIKGLNLSMPRTLEEQQAIADFLSDLDAEIRSLEQRRDKTGLLKRGMMQELLTGRTRLV